MRKLIEAMVIVLIVAISAGLVVSWVYHARQGANQATCSNNLKQLGLAVIHYADFNHAFPTGTIRNPNFPPEKRLSWLVLISPYLSSMQPLLTPDKAWDETENRKLWAVDMNSPKFLLGEHVVFFCPSNPNRVSPDLPSVTHYVGVAGIGENAATLDLKDQRCGVFGYERKIKLTDITDGQATTMMILETMRDNGPWTAGGPSTVRGLLQEGLPYLGPEGQFGSGHGSRTNVGFADGSVRSFTPSFSPRIFEALSTIAGGENVNHFPDE